MLLLYTFSHNYGFERAATMYSVVVVFGVTSVMRQRFVLVLVCACSAGLAKSKPKLKYHSQLFPWTSLNFRRTDVFECCLACLRILCEAPPFPSIALGPAFHSHDASGLAFCRLSVVSLPGV